MVGGTQQCLYASMDEVVYQICFLALYATYSKSPLCPWLCLYAAILHNAVVICFQIYYLWQNDNNQYLFLSVDSIVVICFQIYYLWQNDNNTSVARSSTSIVVICFQIYYLWQNDNNIAMEIVMWKNVVICFQIYYLWQNDNNFFPKGREDETLWFAFRFIIFDRMITTLTPFRFSIVMLWFAFRFIIFDRMITTCYR